MAHMDELVKRASEMEHKPLRELGRRFNKTAREHGWWEKDRNFGELCALFHSEISEAFEEWRRGHAITDIYYNVHGGNYEPYPIKPYVETDEERNVLKPEGIPIELADVLIRVLEICYQYGIDIDTIVELKAQYNDTRPYKHGGKLA